MYPYNRSAWTSRETAPPAPPQVIKVPVPGPERIVEVPGPERIVNVPVPVPGPERIVEVPGPERVVEVPGPERVVEKEVVKEVPVPYPVPVPTKRKCCHNPWNGYGPGPYSPWGGQYQYLAPLPGQRAW